jgi:hypothetical protein
VQERTCCNEIVEQEANNQNFLSIGISWGLGNLEMTRCCGFMGFPTIEIGKYLHAIEGLMVFHCLLIGSGFRGSLGTVLEPNRSLPECCLRDWIGARGVKPIS